MADTPDACPFCGSCEIAMSSNGFQSEFAVCGQCGAEGPARDTVAEAIAAWNTRHGETLEVDGNKVPVRELVRRAMLNLCALAPRRHGEMRWVLVHHLFAHGSTVSVGLCRAFGLDPYEMVKK